jgi:hypothetical protein
MEWNLEVLSSILVEANYLDLCQMLPKGAAGVLPRPFTFGVTYFIHSHMEGSYAVTGSWAGFDSQSAIRPKHLAAEPLYTRYCDT